jgi:long-chain acyl-CoA synthetase
MIKVNGFQVATAELEAVLHGHPAVRHCAVFGVPDERAGEVPVAAVLLDPRSAGSRRRAATARRRYPATYKQLRHIVVVADIPLLPSGKVLRRVLRVEWLQSRPAPARGV